MRNILWLLGIFLSATAFSGQEFLIQEPAFVEIAATPANLDKYLKKIKKTANQDDMSEAGSDIAFYKDEALSFIKEKGLKSITSKAETVIFRTKDGKETKITNDVDGFGSSYYLFDANKPPVKVEEIVTFTSSGLYESYFGNSKDQVCDRTKDLTPTMPKGLSINTQACNAAVLYELALENQQWNTVWQCLVSNQNNGPLSNPIIYSMLFANGFGTPSNKDHALHFACKIEDDLAKEKTSMIKQIESSAADKPHSNLYFCDFASTTPIQAICASVISEKKLIGYTNHLEKYRPTEAQAKAQFDAMTSAAKEFIGKRSSLEIDLSGSGRAIFIQNEKDIQWRDSIETFDAIRLKKIRRYTAADLGKREKVLASLMSASKSFSKDRMGTVTSANIAEVQITWEKFRDATVAYAIAHHQANSDALRCWMTIKRNLMLKGFQ